MSFFTFTKLGRTLLMLSAAVLVVGMFGCGGGDDSNPANNNGGNNTGGNNNNNGGNSVVGNNNCVSGDSCKSAVMPDGKRWITENLNVKTANSWCYGEGGQVVVDFELVTLTPSQVQANCNTYGRLYTWTAAKAACQWVGMRLPTREEWNALVTAAGGISTAGSKLKSSTGWKSYSGISSTDEFHFSALPGGSRNSAGRFYYAGSDGIWWTATEYGTGYAYFRIMGHYYDDVDEYNNDSDKSNGFSARCVQD